jgi:hypothetical protein
VHAWNRPGVVKAGANFEVTVQAGDVVEATVAGAAGSLGPHARR